MSGNRNRYLNQLIYKMKLPAILNKIVLSTLVFPAILSCNRNPLKVDISDIKEEVEVVRFEEALFSLPLSDTLNELTALRTTHPGFFDLFSWKVINIGGIDEENFAGMMGQFLTDTMIVGARNHAEKVFSDFGDLEARLIKAFKYYRYHFPRKELPAIYTMVSGYNQSVVTAENIIGISLDKYLGRDYPFYRQLSNVPMYKITNMHPGKILSDVAYAWGMTEFDESRHTTTLLDHIISQGKLMYLVDAMNPEMHDSLKIGYTTNQLNWCNDNEAQMWNYLIENRLLFSNKRMDILRYTNDGPYTTGFPVESPPRSGIWLGWQIIRKYMKKNAGTSLQELMENTDFQQILNDSEYFPE